MYQLYIDTHFTNLVMALLKDGRIVDKRVLESNKHSLHTVNLLQSILDDNNLKVDDLNEIMVINGPGSFTGVRIGVVIAKIIGFTKNVSLKAISYLQALALNYEDEVILGIKDKNGVFGAQFKNKQLEGDYFYLTNQELDNYPKKIILDNQDVDIEKVYQYLKDKESINPHLLKPLYVKKIEVQND